MPSWHSHIQSFSLAYLSVAGVSECHCFVDENSEFLPAANQEGEQRRRRGGGGWEAELWHGQGFNVRRRWRPLIIPNHDMIIMGLPAACPNFNRLMFRFRLTYIRWMTVANRWRGGRKCGSRREKNGEVKYWRIGGDGGEAMTTEWRRDPSSVNRIPSDNLCLRCLSWNVSILRICGRSTTTPTGKLSICGCYCPTHFSTARHLWQTKAQFQLS